MIRGEDLDALSGESCVTGATWFHQFRRLRVRFERLAKVHEAFLWLGASLICARILETGT